MAELFASGRVVDLIVLLVVLEVAVLGLWHRRTGRGVAPIDLALALLPGVGLLVALRLALTGAHWPLVAGALGAAGLAHLVDLVRRWR